METIHVKFDELTAMAFEHNSLEPDSNRINFQDPSPEASQTPIKEDLDNFFGPMYEEYYDKRALKVSTNSAAPDTIHNDDTPSSTTIIVAEDEAPRIVSTTTDQTSSQTNDLADGSHQEDNADLDGNTFINTFYKWTHAHPLEQVIDDPTKPVMTRSKLATDVEMCMYALTVSTTEPKNIKETMQDHSWIESIQEALHQFDRLNVWELVE
ncbi:hypothetical protein Tco_1471627 [Tanacetum coccineum]